MSKTKFSLDEYSLSSVYRILRKCNASDSESDSDSSIAASSSNNTSDTSSESDNDNVCSDTSSGKIVLQYLDVTL